MKFIISVFILLFFVTENVLSEDYFEIEEFDENGEFVNRVLIPMSQIKNYPEYAGMFGGMFRKSNIYF